MLVILPHTAEKFPRKGIRTTFPQKVPKSLGEARWVDTMGLGVLQFRKLGFDSKYLLTPPTSIFSFIPFQKKVEGSFSTFNF